jgi:hypothetical protein
MIPFLPRFGCGTAGSEAPLHGMQQDLRATMIIFYAGRHRIEVRLIGCLTGLGTMWAALPVGQPGSPGEGF